MYQQNLQISAHNRFASRPLGVTALSRRRIDLTNRHGSIGLPEAYAGNSVAHLELETFVGQQLLQIPGDPVTWGPAMSST
jgi:hypothetical protein